MAFAEFDLKRTVVTFGLTKDEKTELFRNVEPVEASDFLRDWLDEFAKVALGVNSEKARSEFIIAPILAEMKRRSEGVLNVLPGVTFGVDPARGLTGFCDYLIARSPELYYVEAPIVAVVEAKKEDIASGLGQCAAEMVAIQLFNEREGTPLSEIHGCVTSGNLWRFLRLIETSLAIDSREYYLRDLPKILGILIAISQAKSVTDPSKPSSGASS